ncbi:MAG: hypothetical protein KAH32_09105, partial [Chlamydiia bacterium]|nr:hypothetical protein [Chlamydiia bacterium]
MKKIFTLLALMFVTSGLFAQSTYYWVTKTQGVDDGNTGWSTVSGGDTGTLDGVAPGDADDFDSFVIENNGYEVDANASLNVLSFTVNDNGSQSFNIFFTVKGHLNIAGRFIIKNDDNGGNIGCIIDGGYLELSHNTTDHKINRQISYETTSSKLSVFGLKDNNASKINPINKGILILQKHSGTYDFDNADIDFNTNTTYTIAGDGITFKAGSFVFNEDVLIAKHDIKLISKNNIVVAANKSLEFGPGISGSSLSCTNLGARVVVKPGAKIVTNNQAGTINKLTLEGSSSAQGIIVGTGFACTDVNMTVVPSWSRGDTGGNEDYAWRELGSPFAKSVYGGNINWGGNNETNIKGNDGADVDPGNGDGNGSNSFINYWNVTSQQWEVPLASGTPGAGPGPHTSTVNFN